jgi:hypothetical protein
MRKLFARAPRQKSWTKPRRERQFRPSLDHLEDRITPNAYHVGNLNDANTGFATFGSLRYCIAQADLPANVGSTIDFLPGVTGTINVKSVMRITQAMEIDGPGASVITLSGRNLNQIFDISGTGQVIITDLTIANGRAFAVGGAIINQAPLNLSRVTFANNQSSEGGALLNFGQNTPALMTISDCLFTNNHVSAPAGTIGTVDGGAIASSLGSLTVTNTQFTSNYAVGASSTASSSSDQLGDAFGGAVTCFDDLATDTFTGCTFTGNYAKGGQLCTESGTASDYLIGDAQGGAIDVSGCSVVVSSVTGGDQSTFSQNYAQGGTGTDTTTAGGRIGMGLGGAIEVENGGQLAVYDSTFSNNRALGADRGAGLAGTVMNEGAGGAINCEGSTCSLSVTHSIFCRNTAAGGISGFRTGTAINGYDGSNGVGGAINLGLGASGDISAGCTFSYNVARGHAGTGDGAGGYALGGAIDTFPTSLTISDTMFNNNLAQGGAGADGGSAFGGGLNAEGGILNLSDLTFTSNRALGWVGFGPGHSAGSALGGAISLSFTITTADNLDLQFNQAQGGAGVFANGGNAFGGGIYTVDNYLVKINDSSITHNTAVGGFSLFGTTGSGYGGGIVDFNFPGVLQLFNTNVYSNSASTAGDDIFP